MHEEGCYPEVVARLVHWAIEECLLDAGSESTRSWAGSVPYGASVTRSSCSLTCSINESDLSLHDEPFFNITEFLDSLNMPSSHNFLCNSLDQSPYVPVSVYERVVQVIASQYLPFPMPISNQISVSLAIRVKGEGFPARFGARLGSLRIEHESPIRNPSWQR